MNNKTEHFDVIVVGGGASGMMSAVQASERGKKVLILEKNKKLGEKLKISGGGRCNITNNEEDLRVFLKSYANRENTDQFLFSAFSQFDKNDTFKFFESRSLPLVVEARKRAFPNTQKAIDVFNALEQSLKKNNVTVISNSPVKKIIGENGVIKSVEAGGKLYSADAFILATGGLSHPETGSTGDGFKWLHDLGHTIVNPTPSIVPLAVKESYIKKLAGVSLSFMKISFFSEGKKSFSKTGKILFTHFGLSGPLILNSATKVQDLLYAGPVSASIDMYPDTEVGTLDAHIVSIFDKNKNKILKNVLPGMVPEGMAEAVGSLIKTDLSTKVHSVSRDDRRDIAKLLKAMPLTITGLMGFDRAVVADGGVPLTEVDTKTMRSKLYKNLYITGDLLHINRPSGGYSLQLCWTTGFVAGSHA